MTSILLADLECDGMHRGLKSDKKSAIYRGAYLVFKKKELATETNTELFIIIFLRRFLEKKTRLSRKKARISRKKKNTDY